MRIVQMLPSFQYGDAIGNDTIALGDALKSAGYDTAIYAELIDPRLPKGIARVVEEYQDSPDTIILYHLSIGCELNEKLKSYQAKVFIVYHNVTPGHFWAPFNRKFAESCEEGVKSVKGMAELPAMCIADSGFNKQDLISYGYTCPIEVLPILIRFEDYAKPADQELIDRYKNDDYTNILFTGRVAPNKKQEDLIRSFYLYHKNVNPKSRLIIAGGYDDFGYYYLRLDKYIRTLGLQDAVIMTGHIPFAQLLAWYQAADLFLCLSEHEGFCVPLVEAMYFHLPIVAYDSTAIAETLGGSGLLINDKDPAIVSEAINKVISDKNFRDALVERQDRRLKDFDNARIKEQFLDILKKYV